MTIDFERVPELRDIEAARERLAGVVRRTPLLENPLLNKSLGLRLLIKAECLQVTGAFKFRGAWSALSSLTDTERAQGVIAYSSGNHAQAIAYAAALHDTPATIVMPKDAPSLKIANTQQYGAEVVLYNRAGGEDREAIGAALASERKSVLIKPYDNTQVIAGQGTCGLEIAEQASELGIEDAVVLVCCGGGGLTGGIALALAGVAPGFKVRPVEPEHYDDVVMSLEAGSRQAINTTRQSICDAIVTPSPGELTFPLLKQYCDYGYRVTDQQALQAMKVASSSFKLTAEPGGAVALAAALANAERLQSQHVICVISGGNVDSALLARACAG
jgi:threonine dehydratase